MFLRILSFILTIFFLCFDANAQPASWDWRDVGGVNYVSSVKNQNTIDHDWQTCVAHAIIAVMESKAIINGVLTRGQADLSEQVLGSCCYVDGNDCGGSDWGYIYRFLPWLRDTGVPLESCAPYIGGSEWPPWNYVCSSPYVCSTYKTTGYKITSYTSFSPVSVASLKSAIYNYGPVFVEMRIADDFDPFFVANPTGVYSYSYGTFIGHAVSVIGYNDTGSYFICKNSRGTAIEDGGFFKIAYSEVGGQTEFGMYSAYYIGDVYAYGNSQLQGITITGGTIR